MKIEDERAGRLDHVYETSLSVSDCLKRIGNPVDGKISKYKTQTIDGILYFFFEDPYLDQTLSATGPEKYAVRFESMADKTVIRVRYVWEMNSTNIPYFLEEDMDAFFHALYGAHPSKLDNRVWTDSAEDFARQDPLGIHGSRMFWIISALFAILWVTVMMIMGIRMR
ncbi:MAG: hypothetical protein IK078_10210 [Lachnospiraceae bacterium]|nr:hypothetical protein [Lachnospiraceae bacterium]